MPTLSQIHTLAKQCIYDFGNPYHLQSNEGLVGIGGDLSPTTLIYAYLHGFFPWFNHNEPIAWWCPNPRCVLYPRDFSPKKSLQRTAKRTGFVISLNQAFEQVIYACSLPRVYTNDTWIHEHMKHAYTKIHELGLAHSIEVWFGDKLVGGLYGIKIGACFFGESMFHTKTDASKLAFWALTVLCQKTHVKLIDCQLVNSHLLSLGAKTMPRDAYLHHLAELTHQGGVGDISDDWQGLNWLLPTCQLS